MKNRICFSFCSDLETCFGTQKGINGRNNFDWMDMIQFKISLLKSMKNI